MARPVSDHAQPFRLQAAWCCKLESPFTAALLSGLADQIGQGGALDRLLNPLESRPALAVPLRVAGALHALVLTGRVPALAALYPGGAAAGGAADLIPEAMAALDTHEDWCAAFLKSPPQTNETRRAIGLYPGFAKLAAKQAPLHLLELGASAGLNQHWDQFHYKTSAWTRDGTPGAPQIDTDWSGPAPPAHLVSQVASRRACDQAPVDLSDPEARLRLRAYIWPDQPERLARLEAALALADRSGVQIEAANAADWLATQLAGPLPVGTTIIYHSIVWSYFDADTAKRAEAAIRAAGTRADDTHRLAWLRFEHAKVFGLSDLADDYGVDFVEWPGAVHRVIADIDPHARWVRAR